VRLKRLKIHAFRSVQDSELEFGDTTILAGIVGAGKSTHLDAICACLTGRTPHTDRKGKGIKEQIRRGQSTARLDLVCQFNGSPVDTSIGRTFSADSSQQIDAPFGKNATTRQAIISERMGGVDEVPDVLLDPRLTADRPPDEQRQIYIKLCRAPIIEVPKAAKDVGIESIETVQQIDDKIKSLKDGSVRALNGVIENLEETCPPPPTGDDVDAAKLAQKALTDLDARIQDLALQVQKAEFELTSARQQAEEVEKAKPLVAELPTLRSNLESIRADEADLRLLVLAKQGWEKDLQYVQERSAKVAAAKEAQEKLPGLRKGLEDARAELQRCGQEYKVLQDKLRDARATHAKAESNTDDASEDILALEGITKGKCPTCGRTLTDKQKQEMLDRIRKYLETAEASEDAALNHLQALELEEKETSKAGAGARKEVDRLSTLIAATEKAAEPVDAGGASPEDIQASLDCVNSQIGAICLAYSCQDSGAAAHSLRTAGDTLAGRIADAERAEKLITGPVPNVAEIDAIVLDLHGKCEACQIARPAVADEAEAARDTLHRLDDWSRIAVEVASHRAKRENYLRAVESLQTLKDSILGGESAKKLEMMATAVFADFFPQTHVILDPSGASVAPIGSNDGTPVAHLSSGQKVIFDMGLRIAAAKTTGFNLLAMDDANKLAPEARKAMLKALQACGCQVIMCTTSDKSGPIPGAVVYQVSSPGVWGPTKVERVNGK